MVDSANIDGNEVNASASLNDVTVITVTFNSAHCLDALAGPLAAFPHVVIVDNGSDDDTQSRAQALIKHARVIANGRNLGFSEANNIALRQVTTPYALLLNPDCEVSDAGVLELLRVSKEFPKVAIVAPQLMRGEGRPELNYRWPSNEWASSGPGAEGLCCVGHACGAALLFDMSLMRDVGFFDEQFFLYYDDDDLSRRVFDKGYGILIAPHVTWMHQSRGSVKGKHIWKTEYRRGFHHARSKILFTKKYQGAAVAEKLRKKVLVSAIAAMPLRLLAPSPKQVLRLAGRIGGLWGFK